MRIRADRRTDGSNKLEHTANWKHLHSSQKMNILVLLCCSCILLTTSSPSTLVSAQSGPGPFIYDVTQYGAVGDGKTDCTAAVQRAVNALMTTVPNPIYDAPFTSTIYFPPGFFLLSASLPRSTPAYISFASSAWVETFIITGAMPNTTSTYATPLTTIIWNSAEGELINYNGLPPSPIQNNNGGGYLTVANLTIVTPQNIAGWRSMVEFDGVSTFTAVNIIFNGNSISPQMLLFNAISTGTVTLQSITALDVNLFFELFTAVGNGNSVQITMNNLTVTNENYQAAFGEGSASILLQGAYRSLTIQDSTFNSTNLFLQSAYGGSPSVLIENCLWYDSNEAITVADGASVTILDTQFVLDTVFNNDNSSTISAAVTITTSTVTQSAPQVTITDSYFTATTSSIGSRYTAILQETGELIFSNNELTNLDVGLNYAPSGGSVPQPFRLVNNLFSGVGTSATGIASGVVVSGNVCQQSGYMTITCTQMCSMIENSPACFQTQPFQTQPTSATAASHPHRNNKKVRHVQLRD